MFRPISTYVHGILDYITGPALLILPRALGWDEKMTNLLSGAGVFILGYSMLTRYELGLFKVLPMKGHLTLDAISGTALAMSPFLLFDEQERDSVKTSTLIGLGLYEIAAALMTQTESPVEETEIERRQYTREREFVGAR